MKSFFTLICLSIVFTLSDVNAQFTQTWNADYQHTTTPGFSNEGKQLIKDDAGNLYVASEVTSDLDPSGVVTGSIYHYTVLKKYSPSGVLQATSNFLVNNHLTSGFNQTGVFGLEIDANNNIYVGYVFYNSITNYNVHIAKYDTNLARYWIYNFNPSGIEEGVDLKVSPNGIVYGLIKSTVGANVQYQIIKADSGAISAIPFYSFDTNLDVVQSMVADGNDEVFVTGYRWISGAKNALTACVKNSGTIRWKKTYNGGTIIRDDSGNKIVEGANGNELFIVGSSDRGFVNNHDAMVLKYFKSNGRLDWILFLDNNFGFETGLKIYAHNSLTLYTGSVSGNEVIIDRINASSGTQTGRRVYEPLPLSPYNSINSVTLSDMEISADKNIYISGNILATDMAGQNFSALYCAKFYPVTGRVPINAAFKLEFELPAYGDFATSFSSIATLPSYATNNFYVLADVFGDYNTHSNETVRLMAYDFPSPMKIAADGEPNNLLNNDINIFPNPATNLIRINSNMSITKVVITDVTGNTVIQFDNFITSDKMINISMLPAGMYLLTVYDDLSNRHFSKFLKQ